MIGCTRNSRNADSRIVDAKRIIGGPRAGRRSAQFYSPRVYAIGLADRTCTFGGTANLPAPLRSGRALRQSTSARTPPATRIAVPGLPFPLARRGGAGGESISSRVAGGRVGAVCLIGRRSARPLRSAADCSVLSGSLFARTVPEQVHVHRRSRCVHLRRSQFGA